MRLLKIDFQAKKLISAEDLADSDAVPSTEQLAEKPKFFESLLDTEAVLVSVDTTGDKVALPSSLSANRIIMLKWSRKHLPPDFGFDNFGVFGTLQFSGAASFVVLPWHSVIKIEGATSGKNKIWIDQVV